MSSIIHCLKDTHALVLGEEYRIVKHDYSLYKALFVRCRKIYNSNSVGPAVKWKVTEWEPPSYAGAATVFTFRSTTATGIIEVMLRSHWEKMRESGLLLDNDITPIQPKQQNSSLYCSCSLPSIVTRTTGIGYSSGEEYLFCQKCGKESK